MYTSVERSLKQRLSTELYWIRGVAIALVVMGHVIGFTPAYGMRELYQSNLPILGWVSDRINSIHMPIFFAISGLAFSIFGNASIGYIDFFFKKFSRLVIPLVVWSPLYFIFQNLYKGNSFSGIDLIKSIVMPYEIFWFLHALIWITLLTFIYFHNQKSLVIYATLSVIWAAVGLNTENSILSNGYWNLFYAVGLISGKLLPLTLNGINNFLATGTIFELKTIKSLYIILTSLCIVGLLVTTQPQILGFHISRLLIGLPIFFSWLIWAILPLALTNKTNVDESVNERRIKVNEFIVFMGKQSLVIYIFHGYFTRSFALIFNSFLSFISPPAYFFLASCMGILGPLFLYLFAVKKSHKLQNLLGGP